MWSSFFKIILGKIQKRSRRWRIKIKWSSLKRPASVSNILLRKRGSKIFYFSDILRSLGIFSIRKLRKYCGALCLLPSSLIFFMLSSVDCNVEGVLSMICCATAFMGFNAAAFIPSFIDLTPAYRKSLWKSNIKIYFLLLFTIYLLIKRFQWLFAFRREYIFRYWGIFGTSLSRSNDLKWPLRYCWLGTSLACLLWGCSCRSACFSGFWRYFVKKLKILIQFNYLIHLNYFKEKKKTCICQNRLLQKIYSKQMFISTELRISDCESFTQQLKIAMTGNFTFMSAYFCLILIWAWKIYSSYQFQTLLSSPWLGSALGIGIGPS